MGTTGALVVPGGPAALLLRERVGVGHHGHTATGHRRILMQTGQPTTTKPWSAAMVGMATRPTAYRAGARLAYSGATTVSQPNWTLRAEEASAFSMVQVLSQSTISLPEMYQPDLSPRPQLGLP